MSVRKTIGLILVAFGLTLLALKLGHYYDPAPGIAQLTSKWVKSAPALGKALSRLSPEALAYIVLVGLPVVIGGGLLLAEARNPQPKQTQEKKPDIPSWAAARMT